MKAKYLLLLLLSGCTKGFTDINKDPNTVDKVSPQYLLSTALLKTAYPYQQEAFLGKPAEAARYITKVRNEEDDLFDWTGVSWDGYYTALSINEQLYDLSARSAQQQYMAVSRIIKVFNFSYITDLYGDCPYTEALLSKDSGIVHPRYDLQQDIYPDLLKTLKAANDSLANTHLEINSTYDILYAGNHVKWQQFANALHLRLLLRIADYTGIQEIINNSTEYPLFKSNDDNAAIKYLGVTAADSWIGGNLNNAAVEINKYKPGKEIVDTLLSLHDPRLQVWIAPTTANEYIGVPNAIPAAYDYNGGEANISTLSAIFYKNSDELLKATLITYAEQCFILAEAAQRGGVSVPGETAATLYNKGIRASLQQNGISAAAQAVYLDQAGVIYNGTLSQLMTQKWIADFLHGAEGWFDNRRTGLPVFTPGPLSAVSTIPSRYIYPVTEQSYNLTQYKSAVARQGADKITTLIWYLK